MVRRRVILVLAALLVTGLLYAGWAVRPTCFSDPRLVCEESELVFRHRGYSCLRHSRSPAGINLDLTGELRALGYESVPARVRFSIYVRRFCRWPCYFVSSIEVHQLAHSSPAGDGIRVSIYREHLRMSVLGYSE